MKQSLRIKPRTRVKLAESEYFKFRALIHDVESVELQAMKAAQEFKQRAADAYAKAKAYFEQLGKTHGFDPSLSYGCSDETMEIFVTEPKS